LVPNIVGNKLIFKNNKKNNRNINFQPTNEFVEKKRKYSKEITELKNYKYFKNDHNFRFLI